MNITLTDGTTTVELPPGLQWKDEFSWSPVQHSTDYSQTGALIVQEGTRQDGRPITLFGGTEGAWCDRATVEALHALASTANLPLTLALWNQTFSVMFRRPAIEAQEIMRRADPGPDQQYALTVNLMEINP